MRIAQTLERMPRLHRFWPHGQRVTSIDVSADGLVASGGTDGHVRVWSLPTGDSIGSVLEHTGDVNQVAFSPDGQFLASASDDGAAGIWRVRDRQPLAVLRHPRAVAALTFAPDSKSVATASQDGRVRIWRIGDDKPALEIDLGAPVLRVMFTRDGSRFAAAARQAEQRPFTVGMWSTATGAPAGAVISGQPGWWLADADLSPDGTQIVTAGAQTCYCARLWNAQTGAPIGEPLTHRNTVSVARFNPAGTLLVTGGFDRTVQVWNAATAAPAAPPWTISSWPESVRFTANGQLLAATVAGTVELIAPASVPGRDDARSYRR